MAMDDLRSPGITTGYTPPPPVYNPPPPPAKKSFGKKIGLLAILMIVLVGALWLITSMSGNKLLSDPFVDVAPQGEAVKDFPAALLPEDNPFIELSYSVAYEDAGKDFPVVTFNSTKDYEATIDEYRRILVADGWLVLKDGSVEETPLTNFYATKGGAEVNITVEDKEAAPLVTIAYSKPQ